MKTYVAALALFALLAGSFPSPVVAQEIEGKAGMGMSLGVVKYTSGDDWKDGSARFSGQAVFQYGITNTWALQVEAGGFWNNNGGPESPDPEFNTSTDTLSVVFPVTIAIEYRTQLGESNFFPHLALGAGLYNMGVKDSFRHWANDAESGESLLWSGLGGYAKLGTDYFFSESISMNFDLTTHYISADEGDRFSDRFTDENISIFQFRTGVNYFFSLGGDDDEFDEIDETDDGDN